MEYFWNVTSCDSTKLIVTLKPFQAVLYPSRRIDSVVLETPLGYPGDIFIYLSFLASKKFYLLSSSLTLPTLPSTSSTQSVGFRKTPFFRLFVKLIFRPRKYVVMPPVQSYTYFPVSYECYLIPTIPLFTYMTPATRTLTEHSTIVCLAAVRAGRGGGGGTGRP